MHRVAAAYVRVFTLDVRSLAVMRIAVATAVLIDLCARLVHASEHYSDDGVMPRELARSASWLVDTSLLSLSGSPIWAGVVFAAAIGLAIAVAVGWRTRWTTALLWLLVLSIQHRNPWLWDHRDGLFSIALCYGVLLPWGEAFSLDAKASGPRGYVGVPAVAYVLQIACIYLFAALLKTGPEWRSDFTAVEHAISLEYWANPAAGWLLGHPTLMSVLTAAVLAFEAAIALLLLTPWRTAPARWLAVGGLIALQLGFAVFLWLDTFPLIAGAMTLGLLPGRRAPVATPVPEPSRWRTGVALALVLYTIALNVMSFDRDAGTFARRPAELFGIEQSWTMFAPAPTRLDGWFIVEARRANGPAIDLLTGRPVTWERPVSLREGIRTTRELVYMRRLLAMDAATRAQFAATRCASAVAPVSIAVYFMPVLDGARQPPELLAERACR